MTKMSGTFLNSGACDAGPQGEGKESPSNTDQLQTAGRDKYQPYPEYKDSGVEWVGEIPKHWNVLPAFAAVTDECVKNNDGLETNVLSLSYGNIVERDIENNFGLLPDSFNTYQIVNVGDIILRLTDLQNDKRSLRVGLSKLNGIITSAYLKLVCKSMLQYGYAYRLLHSYDTTKVFYGMGGGLRQSMKFDDFRRLPFLIPTQEEQRTIAAFLDYETARIDQLIAKQQQLIELLKEKRQAVISHAVTKGLNPNAPMKDSGVEWLGQVPEHWVVCQFKFITTLMQTGPFGSQLHAEDYIEGGVPLINPAHMLEGQLVPDMRASVDIDTQERLSRHKLVVGDLILARRGELGRCAVVKEENQGWLCGTGSLKVTLSSNMLSDYCYQLINSDGVRAELSLESKGSTMDNLNTEVLGKLRVPFPPIEEQTQILSYIQIIQDRFTSLFTSAAKQIVLLQERRTALISAAVTGKIDLRGWQPPQREVAA